MAKFFLRMQNFLEPENIHVIFFQNGLLLCLWKGHMTNCCKMPIGGKVELAINGFQSTLLRGQA